MPLAHLILRKTPLGLATFSLLFAASAVAADFPLMWVPAANGAVPVNAIIGGREPGRTLPVCRAVYNKGVHPGKVVGNNCNFGYAGREILAPQYDVLVGNPKVLKQSPQLISWIAARGGQVPPGAFFGAHEPGRPILPICQAPYKGGVHVGKVVAGNCNFGYGGLEVLSPEYAVLVVGQSPLLAATSAAPDPMNPIGIAARQNQTLESDMAAIHAETLKLAVKPATKNVPGRISAAQLGAMDLESMLMAVQSNRVSGLDAQFVSQMQAVKARNNAIMALNTQLGDLKAAKLNTTDQATLAKVDVQIKEVTAQIDSAGNTQQMDMLMLQSLSNQRKEVLDSLTSLIKKMNEIQSQIIRNL